MSSFRMALVLFAAACNGPPGGLTSTDALITFGADAAPADAGYIPVGPSLVLDDVHIATAQEEGHAFSLMGTFLNPGLAEQIEDGTMLIGVELRGLDDPSGQSDDSVSVALWTLQDTDGDPTNNFSANSPETFIIDPAGIPGNDPIFYFNDAAITSGRLFGAGVPLFDLLGFLIAISTPELEGFFVPTADGKHIAELRDGRLRLGFPASLFSLLPNIAGEMCAGGAGTMLDVIATGCGLVPLQPDLDLDDDGLEQFYDTDDDGIIDRCVDGDGTEILGTDCVSNPAIADGYRVILALHGVRANLVRAP